VAVIVPIHRPTMQDKFGLTMSKLLEHLLEYLTVLRRLFWEGSADFDGAHFRPLGREATSHQGTSRC
jgi:alkanesulfonate monooxygenase SsuD/methylene tetrahydromethanopterin reductase-like flavin-dependent oxidoreductase (luciferase family)